MISNKNIEELLKKGSKLIAVTKYETDKEVEIIFYIGEEISENEITQQQFDDYMVLCDNSEISEWLSNWKVGKTSKSYYWL